MLNVESLESALPLAEMLDTNRTVLTAIPATALDVMCKATRSDDKFNFFDTAGNPTPDLGNIAFIANAKNETLGYSEHDMRTDEVMEVCIEAVQGHIHVARTLVAPVVRELAEKVAERLNAEKKVSDLLGLQVVIHNAPEVLYNSAFEKEVRQLEDQPFADPDVRLNLPTKSYSELLELMMTGKGSIDDDIKIWAATKGETWFLSLWANLFQMSGDVVPRYHDFVSNSVDGIDYAVAVYLLSRRLVDDVPENTGMDLSSYSNVIIDYRDQAAVRICVALNEMGRDAKAERLVRNMDRKVVIVNGQIYKKWLADGGSNEILFGNMLTSTPIFTGDKLLDAKAELLGAWRRHEQTVQVSESTMRYNRLIAALRAGFQQQMLHLAEGEDASIDNLTAVNRLFEEELLAVRIDDADNLYQICLKLVCRSRFYRTKAETILGAVDRYCREFPGIDPREAAAMATAEYVADWVAELVKPVVL